VALTRVGIRNFRNIAEASDIGLAPTLTVVSGANAQGKSNFLEALGVLLSGLSLRGQGDREMIREGTEGYRLTGDWVVGGETAPLL
jgi:DNA replication and repair protein RecF